MPNFRKYVKVMVNIESENHELCHSFCSNLYSEPSGYGSCTLFASKLKSCHNAIPYRWNHYRCNECKESEI